VRTPVLDVFRPAVHQLCRAYFGLELHGVEHIPADGPVLIVPNHQTYADPPLVTIPIRRPVHYMAWSRLFDIPGLSWLIRRLRAFPVEVDGSDPRATRAAIRILRKDGALMIFPEGGRSVDGTVLPFRPGAFRLAVALGVPVLPVTIAGGEQVWPPGRTLPRPGHITITYHPLLRAEPAPDARTAATNLAERTRAVIGATLSRQLTRSSTR
jgi:1-acyl-sn-glycerol-3-phosphate acyltransferase